MIKLTYSPLNLELIKPNIEEDLTQTIPDFKFKIGQLQLSRGNKSFRLVIQAKKFEILDSQTTQPIILLPKVDLHLNIKSIFKGKFFPRTITISDAKLCLYKDEKGIYLKNDSKKNATRDTNWDVIHQVLNKTHRLKRIHLEGGTFFVEDRLEEKSFSLKEVNLDLVRRGSQIKFKFSTQFLGSPLGCEAIIRTHNNNQSIPLYTLSLKGQLNNLPFDRLGKLWPESLAPFPRNWILTNVSDGHVSHADIETNLTVDFSKPSPLTQIDKLGGTIKFTNMTVDYFGGFPKIKQVNGTATYDSQNFYIKTTSGVVKSLNIPRADMIITDMHLEKQDMKIDMDVQGPIKDALQLIDTEPLNLAQNVNFDTTQVSGFFNTRVHFSFPVEATLTTDKVQVNATSSLKNVNLPQSFKNSNHKLQITEGNLKLTTSKAQMQLDGTAFVNGNDSQIHWTRNFTSKAPWQSQYKLSTKLQGNDLSELTSGYISGHCPLELTYTQFSNKSSSLEATADLTQTEIQLPQDITLKPTSELCQASFSLKFQKEILNEIQYLKLNGPNINVHASGKLDSDLTFTSLNISPLHLHETDIIAKGHRDANGIFHLKLSGGQFDLEPFTAALSKSSNNHTAPCQIQASLKLDSIRLGNKRHLRNVQGFLRGDKNQWTQYSVKGELPGKTEGKQNFLQVIREPKKKRDQFRVISNDAGATLQLLDITDSAHEGQLKVEGEKHGDGTWHGNISINRFYVTDTPVMTQLLSLASPFGLFDALSGQSVTFNHFQSAFIWHEGKLLLKKGRASGISLGFTVDGYVDRTQDTLSLQGAVLPYNVLNFLLKIPIVGQLLGGKERGAIWGVSYTLNGLINSPKVNVNPFSTLTPGFLRFIFEPSIEDKQKELGFPDDRAAAPVRSPHKEQTG